MDRVKRVKQLRRVEKLLGEIRQECLAERGRHIWQVTVAVIEADDKVHEAIVCLRRKE